MPSKTTDFSLAVAIPTFNRNVSLAKVLTLLSQQPIPNTHIYVLDNNPNGSAIHAINQSKIDTIFPLFHLSWPGNVGGNENIIRCLEFADTDYVWILGDDDYPAQNALDLIRAHIIQHPCASVFNFYWPDKTHSIRSRTVRCDSFSNYMDQFSSIGESLFISSLIFKRSAALQSILYSYQWQSSYCPGMTLAHGCFSDGSYGLVSHRQIVEYREQNTVHSNVLSIAAGMTTLRLLPFTESELKSLDRLSCWFTPLTLLKQALVMNHMDPSCYYLVSRHLYTTALNFRMRPFNLIGRASLLILSTLLAHQQISRTIDRMLTPFLRKLPSNLSLDR